VGREDGWERGGAGGAGGARDVDATGSICEGGRGAREGQRPPVWLEREARAKERRQAGVEGGVRHGERKESDASVILAFFLVFLSGGGFFLLERDTPPCFHDTRCQE